MDSQVELPFMEELRQKSNLYNTFNEEDIIMICEGADLAWMNLLFVDNWFELSNFKSDIVTEVVIFQDKETKNYYRAERRGDNPYDISNAINKELTTWFDENGSEEELTMIELPLVHLQDSTWHYL